MERKQYKGMRPHIKSGDLVAWQGRFTNRNILKLFNQQVGHVGIAWVVSNRVFVIHVHIPEHDDHLFRFKMISHSDP